MILRAVFLLVLLSPGAWAAATPIPLPIASQTEEPRPVTGEPAAEPSSSKPAPSALAEAVDREIARAEAHVSALESIQAELERRNGSESARLEAAGTRAAEFTGRLQIREARSAEIWGLYNEIVGEVKLARRALDDALDRLGSRTAIPAFEPRLDTAGLDVPAVAERLRRLEALRKSARETGSVLAEQERALRRQSVEDWGSITQRLNGLRIQAIASLPEPRRRQVLGLGRDGIAQLRREIDHLRISTRLYKARRWAQLDQVPGRLADVFAIGTATWTLLKIVVALILFSFLRRNGKRIRNGAYRLTRQFFVTAAGQRRGELLVRSVEVVAPWGLFLALVAAIRWLLGPLAGVSEIDLALRIATLYGVYRLAIDVLVAVTLRLVRRYRLTLDEKRASEILRSVRTMMRVVVGILVMLMLSERLVGRGHLYYLVVRFAWVFVVAAAVLLLARWRRAIADAYLGLGTRGRWTTLVERSRDRWYGVFVSAAAFVLLAGRALFRLGRDFAMGFDQTRRALAFMFRRRVEKHAEQLGYADTPLDQLPPRLVEAFAETPVTDATPAIQHYPGLDRLQAMVEPWLENDTGASFLLTGEKGMGKTSWLHRIDPGEVAIDHISLTHRVLSEARLVNTLNKELKLALGQDAGISAVRRTLLTGPKRVITIDLGQNLFLGMVGGYDTFEEFVSLVDATCDRVFWVCAVSAFAWDHLAAVRADLNVFRDHQVLTAWSEEQLGTMLRARTASAGVEVVYDDLLLDAYASRDPSRRVETAEQYTRLLWDYSDGNPRVALYYWQRSLVPESEGRLRVRLFRAPTPSDLDGLGDRSRFLLAAIVVHENLSLQEAADVTRYPKAVCRLQLERLRDEGVLRQVHGRYRLTTRWHRAVIRFLKRGNLLSD